MKMKFRTALALSLAFLILFTGTAMAHSGENHSNESHSSDKHSNSQHETETHYYYCNGHSAHEHPGGVCPYAGETAHHTSQSSSAPRYNCNGHSAHEHRNGVCPYLKKDHICIGNFPSKMAPGDEIALDWTLAEDGDAVTWSSSNPDVVCVSENGTVCASHEGSAKITAHTGHGSKSFSIKVSANQVKKITLNCPETTGSVGSVLHIGHSLEPANASFQDLDWSSSNENVAAVLGEGYVLLTGEGKCKITATARDKGHKAVSITLHVGGAADGAHHAKLPHDLHIQGKCGSHAIRFAQENNLEFSLTYPKGLPCKMGSKGEAVRDLQAQLIRLQYLSGKADGVYGKKTHAALTAFYADRGIVYDDEICPEDYDEIMSAVI